MKVRFLESCTIYPDGQNPVEITELDVISEAVKDYAGDYAQLLIDKGHAVSAEEKPAKSKAASASAAPPTENQDTQEQA